MLLNLLCFVAGAAVGGLGLYLYTEWQIRKFMAGNQPGSKPDMSYVTNDIPEEEDPADRRRREASRGFYA